MSFEYYSKWWVLSRKQLEKLYDEDQKIIAKDISLKDRNQAQTLIGGLYAKYAMVVQDIDACLDQLAEPQRRETVRKLVDAATIRLTELSEELRKVDLSEIHYVDGNLIELKLVPYDIEILHPALMYPRPIDIEDLVQKILAGERIFTPPEPEPEPEENPEEAEEEQPVEEVKKISSAMKLELEKEAKKKAKAAAIAAAKSMTPEQMEELKRKEQISNIVRIIQTAERARQSRVYFSEKGGKRKLKQLMDDGKKLPPRLDPKVKEAATTVIQKFVRGHLNREMLKRREAQRRILIGMTMPNWKSKEQFEIFEKNVENRREYRDQRIRDYINSIDQEKARVLRVVGPGLMEDIGDEIREWFYQWYIRAKNFDKYPDVDKGGTVLVVRGETMTPEEWINEVERKRREKVKKDGRNVEKERAAKEKQEKQAAELKKKEAEKKKAEAEKAKKKKKKKLDEFEMKLTDTTTKNLFDKAQKEFREIWDERKVEDNPLEKHYMDMITEEKCYETQLEVREKVDELMRLELELLEAALDRDRKRHGEKKRKKPKAKKKKKKKSKGKKDMTKDRTTEDLFQELVDNQIIRTYPKVSMDEFRCDFSFKNWNMRKQNRDPPGALMDVRQAVIMNCILPMGVQEMKKPKSVLIAGARQSGKHLLANAVFNGTRCVLFDLSPEITAGKYPGQKGMKMLLHLVSKMSKILAPSIIFIDGAERLFYKKVPREERGLEPKRLGKKLFSGIVKPILPEDRVLVLGITGKPWAGQAGKIKKAFERSILIPRPDYNSVYMFWQDILIPYFGIDRNFDFTSLATATVNYTFTDMKIVVDKVLNPRRIIQLSYKPLRPEEVYEAFLALEIEPITDKEYKKYQKWYYKTPLGKQRMQMNKFFDAQRQIEAKLQEKAASDAKKKA